jgi:hypothetical protein
LADEASLSEPSSDVGHIAKKTSSVRRKAEGITAAAAAVVVWHKAGNAMVLCECGGWCTLSMAAAAALV